MYLKFNDTLDTSSITTPNNTHTRNLKFQNDSIDYSSISFVYDSSDSSYPYRLKYGGIQSGLEVGKASNNREYTFYDVKYQYLYIEDSYFEDLYYQTKNWLLNNTTICTGYFQELNDIQYFVDMQNSPDSNIYNNFTISDSIDKYKPLITPVTNIYWTNNFNDNIYKCLYLSFAKDNNTKYIIKNSSGLSIANELFYNSTFYIYRTDGNKEYLKFIDLETNDEYFIVGTQTGNRVYLELVTTIGSDIEAYYNTNDSYIWIFNTDTSELYYFDGTTTVDGKLNTTTDYSKGVSVSMSNCTQNDYSPCVSIDYKYQSANCKAYHHTPMNVTIDGNITKKLPYEFFNTSDTPDVQISSDNVNWVNARCLNYILPNYTYYKSALILNTPMISLLNNVVSWNSVSNASGYRISITTNINGTISITERNLSASTTSYTLDTSTSGLIRIFTKVKALGNGSSIVDSSWSDSVVWNSGVILTVVNYIQKSITGYILSQSSYTIGIGETKYHSLTPGSNYFIGFETMGYPPSYAEGWTEADRKTHTFSSNEFNTANADVTYTLSQSGTVKAKSYTISCQGSLDVGKTRFLIPVPFDYNSDDYYSNGEWKSDNTKTFTVTPPVSLGIPSEITLNPLCLTFNGNYTSQTYSFDLQNMKISKPNINID